MTEKFNSLAEQVFKQKYAFTPDETWRQCCERVVKNVLGAYPVQLMISAEDVNKLIDFMDMRLFIPAGRYLYASGRELHQTQNCCSMEPEDSREGWADLMSKAARALQTGAGIGIDYSKIRPRGSLIRRTGGEASGPVSLAKIINEIGREIKQGGSRRSALLAQLSWKHRDLGEFIRIKNWSEDIKALKAKDFNFPAPMDGTNISVRIGNDFFTALEEDDPYAGMVYNDVTFQMCSTGEPGFIINHGNQSNQRHTNACSEARFDEPENVCNLGSINLARVTDIDQFRELVRLGSLFLYCGTYYSDLPFEEVYETRDKTRQIGLGLMGIHEWFIKNGLKYGEVNEQFEEMMKVYSNNLEMLEPYVVDSPPSYGRAVAPTGSLSILAQTTGGIEPIYAIAYKRRYLRGDTWHYQYQIESIAKRMIEEGVAKEQDIEDAFSIDYERRIAFQAYVQQFVDQAISSTINLPQWGTEGNNETTLATFRKVLRKYLKQLRGITTYPDASRGGQPLTPVKLSTALKYTGQDFEEVSNNVCDITGAGCGG